MSRSDPQFYAELARSLHGMRDAGDLAQSIVTVARDAVACGDAGVSLVAGGCSIVPAASTSTAARRAEELQRELGDGPGPTALVRREGVLSGDLETEPRWPVWSREAVREGYRSTLALPLRSAGRSVALLQLYSPRIAGFGRAERATAELIATYASIALASANQEQNLRRAVDSRTVIGQAEGILMERYGFDAETAFAVLKRYSQDGNVKLRVVAGEVARTRRLPDGLLPHE